ncbi:unnamed protein product [Euphydryas editha]|uniref:RNA-directed DNA polymerase n=1 Tax=Euphydryas editha TaxID=104508 RepID=A0AAU9VF97_EUPED|nr:unnamed protein product [Euphydryas editha]
MMESNDVGRSSETPRRSRSRSRRSLTRGRDRDSSRRSRSYCRRLQYREEALKQEQRRVRQLEHELQRERDTEQRRQRSVCRGSPQRATRDSRNRSHSHSCSSRRGPSRGHKRVRHRSNSRVRDEDYRGDSERSCSPSFSSKEVTQIIKSVKDILPSQPSHSTQISNRDSKNIIPEFNPSEKNQRMDIWLKKVNECAMVYGWDERSTVHFAMQKLSGLAKIWYESQSSILYSWPEWQAKLLNAFPCEQNYGQLLEDMLKRKSRINEPIQNYFYEKLSLLNQCDISGKRAVDCVIHGISDRTTRSSALALRCDEPDDLLKFLISNNRDPYTPQQIFLKDRNLNTNDDKVNHRSNMKTNPGLFCYNCKEKGHPFSRCPKPLVKCSSCDKVGHKAELCRSKQETASRRADGVPKTMRISSSKPNNKFTKKVIVEDMPYQAYIDLDSEVTLIAQSSLAKLGLSHDQISSTMIGFGNNLVSSLGSVKLNISIDGVEATVCCRVVEDQFLEKDLIIGQNFTEQPHVVVYKDVNRLQFIRVDSDLPNFIQNDDDERLHNVSIVARCELQGTASVKVKTGTLFTGSIIVDTKIVGKLGKQYIIYGGVYEVKDGSFYVIIRPCAVPCQLQKNSVVARAERVDSVYRLVSGKISTAKGTHTESTSVKKFNESLIQIGETVPKEAKTKLIEVLRRHEHCFAHSLTDLVCTNAEEMNIELSSQRPVVYRPYRLSSHEREKVREMIDEMLEAGIIRESTSNYASPIILVRKKDGGIRLCVDYRLLNSLTLKERYPIPIIEDEVARLSGQAWFITLDLMSGYYQVPIAEESKHWTAFVTPDGHYEYNRMPFGLANAPAVFQRMMNHVLGQVRFNKATVYLDDLLIFGKTPFECISRLEEVLKLLENAQLKLNLSKCSFLQTKIDYLGYEISAAGMRPGSAKIQSVVDFPLPQNVHNMRQFLGLGSYFRKFIQSFAQIAYPLTKLLKKNATWEWTTEQEDSFDVLKSKLIERPVLALYDPTAKTELHTDASKVGIGGILLQRPTGSQDSFHPVAYYSRQTTPEERNFHSYELETLAVICALKKFRVYLLGKPFKVVTDCNALRSTFEKRDLIPRIARWWIALQEFDCHIEYRPGTRMGHVDALSRNPTYDMDTTDHVRYPPVLVISDEDWLLTLQLGDPDLCRIRDIVSSKLDSKGLAYIRYKYVLKNNKLFRCLGGDKENVRWVVPKGARWQLCKMNHDDIGHVGYEKTLERMKKSYWFAKMKRFTKKYVSACIDCAYAKKAANGREGLLHPIEKVAIPFHTLHVDHLGPFVKSKRGFTHTLNVVDSFTKFLFIKPVWSTSTQNVIKALQDIFDIFRAPDRLVSDRGSCFTSQAFRRTILDCLTAQNLRDNEKEWDNKIGKIQWGLNNTIQKTTGKTPAEIMFGTSMNSEVKPALNAVIKDTREVTDLSDLRTEVKERIDEAQAVQKKQYDRNRYTARTYTKGDLVKITKVAFQGKGQSTKLMPSYEGPFKVIKVIGNDRYRVAPIAGFEGMKGKRKTTVAADRMKPWIHVDSLGLNETDNEQSDTESIE